MEDNGLEPNVVDNEENNSSNISSAPTPPKKPNARVAASNMVKTTANITRKVLEIFAAMPLPLKIAIIVIIAIVILVVVVLEAEAAESTDAFTDSVDNVVNSETYENLSDEAKASYEKYGSFIKFPIEALLLIYDDFANSGDFGGAEIRENYNYVLGTNEVEIKEGSSAVLSGDMEALAKKAVEMAKKGGITYSQSGRQLANSMQELDAATTMDCSSFVYSVFKACLGINVDSQTEAILAKGEQNYSENGWTAEVHAIGDGDLKPGDILYRFNHVGIYVGGIGEKNLVDHGGPGSGPNNKDYENRGYTHYIRYTKN